MSNKDLYVNISSKIIYLLPLSILLGPFLADLSISILALTFIIYLVQSKDYKYIKNKFFIIFLLLCIYLILNSIVSETPLHSLKSSLVYFRFGIFAIATWFVIDHNNDFKKNFISFLYLAIIIALIYGFYQILIEDNLIGNNYQIDRLELPFTDNAVLGQYLARLFPFLMAFFLIKENKRLIDYISIFFIFILSDILIYFSGERTALGLIFISSIAILTFVTKFKLFRLITILFSVIIIIFISLSFPETKKRNVDYTIKQLGLNNEDEQINLFSPEHEKLIFTSYSMFIQNPFIGIGPNNYRNQCDDLKYSQGSESCQTHPHNYLVQLFAEIGIVGSIFFILAIINILRIFSYHLFVKLKYKKNIINDYQICLMICFFSSFWPFFPTLNLFNNWINIIYYLPVGFYLHEFYKNDFGSINLNSFLSRKED